jgi:hypothetical protein
MAAQPLMLLLLPFPLLLQDLRLGTASLAALDLENCSHLREVQLSGGGGGVETACQQAASGNGTDGRLQKVGSCAVQPATAGCPEMPLAHAWSVHLSLSCSNTLPPVPCCRPWC